tara:strand:+ start:2160 stop:2351 length:192 start_codon:yes stop_codon:yes gene_type:complete
MSPVEAMTTLLLRMSLVNNAKAHWVELCIEHGIDFEKYGLDIKNFGTRFEVQIPEFTFNEEEE